MSAPDAAGLAAMLDALEAAAKAATPGPWRWEHSNALAGGHHNAWILVAAIASNVPMSEGDAKYFPAVGPDRVLALVRACREVLDDARDLHLALSVYATKMHEQGVAVPITDAIVARTAYLTAAPPAPQEGARE